MIDKDGSFIYSETKSVKGSNLATDFLMFPNPGYTNSKITISQLDGPTVIKVFDVSGRIVKNSFDSKFKQHRNNGFTKRTLFRTSTDKNSGIAQVKKLSVIN